MNYISSKIQIFIQLLSKKLIFIIMEKLLKEIKEIRWQMRAYPSNSPKNINKLLKLIDQLIDKHERIIHPELYRFTHK